MGTELFAQVVIDVFRVKPRGRLGAGEPGCGRGVGAGCVPGPGLRSRGSSATWWPLGPGPAFASRPARGAPTPTSMWGFGESLQLSETRLVIRKVGT